MSAWKTIADIRREYGELSLTKDNTAQSPVEQFKIWFEEVLNTEKSDPTAMILATVDAHGFPDARVVLLKGIEQGNFIFYTNYNSSKAQQLNHNPRACLNFYWPEMSRQVRIRGMVQKVDSELSDDYFSSRPILSQYAAIASPQSREIESRQVLEAQLNALIEKYGQQAVQRPEFWGGYRLQAETFEFWQGRDNRLHDRIQYYQSEAVWKKRRVAP